MTDKNSLIKSFHVESVTGLAKNKVTFVVVNDKKLIYYTNSDNFLESLKKFEGQKFIIEYAFSELSKPKPIVKNRGRRNTNPEPESEVTDVETKIVRVKLPKIK